MSNFNTGITLPSVNISDTNDNFIVEMAIPGLKKSDFNINVEDDVLTISAEINEEHKEEVARNYSRREFGYSSFKRTFSLPESVETEKITAQYNDGILNLTLPKREEAKQKPSRMITVS
jgi:HSP20 family protein